MSENGAGKRDAGRVVLHLVTGACLLFSVALVANNIYPTRCRLDEMRQEKDRLEKEIEDRRTEIERLDRKGYALEHDPITIERENRRTFKTTREGEKIVKIVGEDE
ncbi:MAG: septum formation initiator family protein [Planctomycetota bacterium]